MGKTKHDEQWNDAMQLAISGKKCPYIFSSQMADVYWITAWALENYRVAPIALHSSIGSSWLVELKGKEIMRAWVDKPNAENGIRFHFIEYCNSF